MINQTMFIFIFSAFRKATADNSKKMVRNRETDDPNELIKKFERIYNEILTPLEQQNRNNLKCYKQIMLMLDFDLLELFLPVGGLGDGITCSLDSHEYEFFLTVQQQHPRDFMDLQLQF